MSTLSLIALTVVVVVLGMAALDAFERWWARRRIRQIHAETLEIARQCGIPPEELE